MSAEAEKAPVNTKSITGRRELRFETVTELREEIERVVAAASAGNARTLGNWSVAQILQHLGKWLKFSFDGFPYRYPWYMRAFAWPMKRIAFKAMYRAIIKPGFTNPKAASPGEPNPDVTMDDAADLILGQIRRIDVGERMTAKNPAAGSFTHDQWIYAHLRHAEMHLSFVRYGES